MEFKNKNLETIAYTSLIVILFVLFITLILSNNNYSKYRLRFREITNQNSNIEGFKNNKNKANPKISKTSLNTMDIDTDTLLSRVDKHLKTLITGLGNPKEVKQTREIWKKTKKISDIESSKCIMKLLEENGDKKDFDIDDLINNDYDKNCQKYKKYTALSQSLQSIINSI